MNACRNYHEALKKFCKNQHFRTNLGANLLRRSNCTPYVYLNEKREVSVAIEICVQHIESSFDMIVIRDDEQNPVGLMRGIDLLNNIRKNPSQVLVI